jgi:hypothetical protein
MKEFKKWRIGRGVKTIGYIYNSDAYNAGEKAGWKAALKWVRTLPSSGTYKFSEPMQLIEKELEE